MAASVVIGQPTMTANSANQGGSPSAQTLDTPDGVSWLSTGQLIIGEYGNNRYLVYNNVPETNNSPADWVWGQPNFSTVTLNTGGLSATSLAKGRNVAWNGAQFFMSDMDNNRVLVFNSIPTSSLQAPAYVIGQPNFTSNAGNNGGISANTLASGFGSVSADNGYLIVTDPSGNLRTLIYRLPITSNMPAADLVLGQPNMTSNSWIHPPTASLTDEPTGAIISNGKLLIPDRNNNRVLIYNSIPSSNGSPADVVIGHNDFISDSSGAGANQLAQPHSVAVDSSGRLYIADTLNNRILVYNSIPTSNGASANYVIGQPDMSSSSVNQGGSASAYTLNRPTLVDVNDCHLFVVDQQNHRVLIY
jgi:hypothetical protein